VRAALEQVQQQQKKDTDGTDAKSDLTKKKKDEK
jgi:hypothetical protein